MFYRKDLTDKLVLSVLQNPNEFYKWMVTISNSNLNGKGDKVYGFGGQAFFGQNDYILSIFGCPNGWQVESDGSFTYYIETEQFQQEQVSLFVEEGCRVPQTRLAIMCPRA